MGNPRSYKQAIIYESINEWQVRILNFFLKMDSQSFFCTYTHTCTHKRTHEHMHTHTHMHTITHTHTHAHTHTHTRTHTHTHTHMPHTYTWTHTHTHCMIKFLTACIVEIQDITDNVIIANYNCLWYSEITQVEWRGFVWYLLNFYIQRKNFTAKWTVLLLIMSSSSYSKKSWPENFESLCLSFDPRYYSRSIVE